MGVCFQALESIEFELGKSGSSLYAWFHLSRARAVITINVHAVAQAALEAVVEGAKLLFKKFVVGAKFPQGFQKWISEAKRNKVEEKIRKNQKKSEKIQKKSEAKDVSFTCA